MWTYTNRPGLRVEVRANERPVAIPQENPTQSVLIIGTAVDGPSDEVVAVTQLDSVSKLYGPVTRQQALGDLVTEYQPGEKAFNNNWLTLAAQQAYDAGCRNILLFRLGGRNKAKLYLDGYNRIVAEQTSVPNLGSTADLQYGNVPMSNAATVYRTTTAAAVANSSLVTVSASYSSTQQEAAIGWHLVNVSNGNEYLIVGFTSSSVIQLASAVTIASGSAVVLYPPNMYSVIGSNGQVYNPANFTLGPGSGSVPATLGWAYSVAESLCTWNGGYPSPGDTVYVNYYMQTANKHVIQLEAPYGNDYSNGRGSFGTSSQDGIWAILSATASLATLSLYKPKYKGGTVDSGGIPVTACTISLHSLANYQQLVNTINRHPNNNFVRASLLAPGTGTGTEANWNGLPVEINPLTQGGESGLAALPCGNPNNVSSKQLLSTFGPAPAAGGSADNDWSASRIYEELSRAETGALALLEGQPANVVVVPQAYLDDPSNDFAGLLGIHMYRKNRLGLPGQAVIGCRPKREVEITINKINAHVQALTSGSSVPGSRMLQGFMLNEDGNDIDLGVWLVCLGGPDVVCLHRELGRYTSNGAVHYAAAISRYAPHEGIIYKQIGGIEGLAWHYTPYQQELLRAGVGLEGDRGAPYVIFLERNGRVLSDIDNTAARRRNQFATIPTIRVVNDAIVGIRAIGMGYIGKPNTAPIRQAMERNIKSFLDSMAAAGALEGAEGSGYMVNVLADDIDVQLNRVIVNLHLRPVREILFVELVITIEP